MEIRIRQAQTVIILDLVGKVDVNSANFIEAIGDCLREGYTDFLCNFSEVDFIDYIGVSVLVVAYKDVVNHNGRMKFTCAGQHLRGVFAVAGLDKVIEILNDEEDAIKSFDEDKTISDIQKLQLRRRFKRLPIDIKVELKAKSSASAHCLKVDIVNISAIGAFIFGCNAFKLGDEVVVSMKLPPSDEIVSLDAVVVWLADKQVQPHEYPGMGIEFSHISSSVQEKLLKFIERNLSSLASE